MYDMYKWQFDAISKGRLLAQLDERERLAELSANIRYTMYAKKIKPKQLFDRQKEERNINRLFTDGTPKAKAEHDFAQRVQFVNNYFQKKHKREEDVSE